MNFFEMLDDAVEKNSSLLCIGLDPETSQLPSHLKTSSNPLFDFNKQIIDATHDLVCAYKPNAAFYESMGSKGIQELEMTCEYLKNTYPHIPVILDAKRGDIDNTNRHYAEMAFDVLKADAVTVHPYLGKESLQPFLDYKEKGIFVLVKTSNGGAKEIQDLEIGETGKPLYEILAKKIGEEWNENGNCALVVGATYAENVTTIRTAVGNMIMLMPGVGSQGGDVEASVKAGIRPDGKGLVMSASRSVLYASTDEDFAQKAREKAQELRELINIFRH